MNRIASRLWDWWAPPTPAARLALFRIAVGLFALVYLGPRYDMVVKMAASDPGLFEPVGVAAVLDAPMSAEVFRWLVVGTLVAGGLFTVGAGARVTGPAFAGLLLWVLCYRNSWSMIFHSDNLLVLHVIVLALTRSADTLSFDAWARERTADPESRSYGWPVSLICGVTVSVYFLCAVAKLAGPLGVGWATGRVLRDQIAVDSIRKDMLGEEASDLFPHLAGHAWLFTVPAVGSLALELFAPAALFSRRFRYLWVAAAFAMHWGIYALMHITFRYQMWGVMFLSFLPLERAGPWLMSAARAASRPKKCAPATAGEPPPTCLHN